MESLVLVSSSPRGKLGAGQLENAETVSWSIYSGSQSNLLCVIFTTSVDCCTLLPFEYKFKLNSFNMELVKQRKGRQTMYIKNSELQTVMSHVWINIITV